MALAEDVERALQEHIQEFIEWMADGWTISDVDLESSIINNLPSDPAKAYQMGYNAACEGVDSAYQCYCDDLN